MITNIIYKIKERYRNVYLLFLDLVTKPQEVLQEQYFDSRFGKDSLMKSIVFPLSLFSSIVSFIGYFIYTTNSAFQDGVLIAIFNFLKLYFTAFFAVFLLRLMLNFIFKKSITQQRSEMAVCSMMIVNFTVSIMASLMPFLFFVKFIYICQFYIAWVAASSLIQLDENKHNIFMGLFTLVMWVLPLVIDVLLGLLVPNLNGF